MQQFSVSPVQMIRSLWVYRGLILTSIRREVAGKYSGSYMGVLWAFINPLLMLAVYTFVFSIIFQARWGEGTGSKSEFALVLFSGLIVFNLFSECINRAPGLIVSNKNYVKKVVYPLEILSWVGLGVSLFHTVISLLVWFLAYAVFFGVPHVTVLYLPLVLLPLILLIMGLSWVICSIAVYVRDVDQFVGIATTVLLFLSPIFYPVASIPEKYRSMIYLNPLTPVIEQVRDVLYWGVYPDFKLLALYIFATALVAVIGFCWFQKTRKGFADVL